MEDDKLTEIDPDYQIIPKALETIQTRDEESIKETVKGIRKIISDEFDKELSERQKQLEDIEEQIFRAQKLLHLVRYVLVTSYYNKSSIETSEENSRLNNKIIDDQNRIHPAIKRLIGNNPDSLQFLSARTKRKTSLPDQKVKEEPVAKKIKLEPKLPEETEKKEITHFRSKVKHRVVVGNISKWMPSLEDDTLTHRWMVYVRGPKEAPDVDGFIEKVVFYLHPSYKPHDVVEIKKAPFHLSRRGWGEFPIRVQIFFKCSLNKPVDIVHNLKLDKSNTGRQTLGNETVVDLYLHTDQPYNNEPEIPTSQVKSEPEENTNLEHNYCNEEVKTEEPILFSEHCYSLPASEADKPLKKPKQEPEDYEDDNKLRYGLDESYETNSSPIKDTKTNKIVLLPGKILLSNGKVFTLTKSNAKSILKTNLVNEKKDFAVGSLSKFKNMGEVLLYLFKKLPLCSEKALEEDYRAQYPFTAVSLAEYNSWNVGKRLNAEWNRAKIIKKLLSSQNFFQIEKWTTKAILMYGRSHGFSHTTSYELFKSNSEEKALLMSCFDEKNPNFPKYSINNALNDREIDILDDKRSPDSKNNNYVDIIDRGLSSECSFVRQAALNCGVVLKAEEILPNVKFNGAERMILEATKCFAEGLIRRAMNQLVCKGGFNCNEEIGVEEINEALMERPEFSSVLNFQKKMQELTYFF